jgi:hypothetical protein
MVKPSVGQVIYVNTAGRETKSKAFPEVVCPHCQQGRSCEFPLKCTGHLFLGILLLSYRVIYSIRMQDCNGH